MSDQPSIIDTDENVQPDTEDDEQTAKPSLVKETPNPIPKTMSAWQAYYDEMGQERQRLIARLSKQSEFKVILRPDHDMADPDKKLTAPDEPRTFIRRKISNRDFWEIERRRGVLKEAGRTRPSAVIDLMLELYEQMAYIYLENKDTGKPITKNEFERINWPVNKAILDACNLSSVGGQVPLDEQI